MTGFTLGVLLATFLLGLLWKGYVMRHRELLKQVSEIVLRAASGNLRTRLHMVAGKTEPAIVQHINHMLNSIEQRVTGMAEEQNVLHHILDGMTTGIVYIVSSGRVEMMNPAAQRMLKCPPGQWRGKKHWEVFRHYGLNAAIEQSLLFGESSRQELRLHEDVTLDFRVMSLERDSDPMAQSHNIYNVLVLCNDVTQWHRLEQMRRDFIANVSHELKTPLTAIQGFTETLMEESSDEDTRSDFLKVMYDESIRMKNLVEDLLVLSKLETQDSTLNFHSFDLANLVKRAVDPLKEEIRKHNLELHFTSCSKTLVWGDEDQLVHVLLNLLMNAIHYTPTGGKISVSWEIFPNEVKLHIMDTGVGIPVEHQKRIFERFYRVNRDRSRASGGTGLGLAIVKHIVSAHGGKVGVISQSGHGSDFWFTLPKAVCNRKST